MNSWWYGVVLLTILLYCAHISADYNVECSTLRMGQYICPDPDPSYNFIDPKTQQPYGCTKENKAKGGVLFTFSCCDIRFIV
jgi:hypothetical protein